MANAIECTELKVPNAIFNSTSREVGSVVGITCEDGYTLDGVPVLTCQDSGHWSDFWPYCEGNETEESDGGNDQVMVIVICSVATLVALFIVVCAVYMLCANIRKERKDKDKEKERDFIVTIRDMSNYHSGIQDSVGMPAVIYGNINSTMRGRSTTSDESSTASPDATYYTIATSDPDLTSSKAFIY